MLLGPIRGEKGESSNNNHAHFLILFLILGKHGIKHKITHYRKSGDHVLQHFLSEFDFKSTLSLLRSGPRA